MADGWTVDVRQWGDGLIYAFAVSGALFGLWKMWFKNVVEWIKEQGETNAKVAHVVSDELPKITHALERISDVQRDHGRKLEDLDHRVATIEGVTTAGSSGTSGQKPPLTPRRRQAE
jgi:hypothetical protein